MQRTIAFSNSKNVWTTRYSFISACMGWIRNFMVSAPRTSMNNQVLYKHDESSSDNNRFYGVQAASTIGVTFNDKPSSNKQFKSFSIESGDPSVISGLNTFVVNRSGTQAVDKNTTISSLREKGGIVYGNIPEEERTTMSNIEYIGQVQSVVGLYDDSDEISLDEAEALGYPQNISDQLLYVKLDSVESVPLSHKGAFLLREQNIENFRNIPTSPLQLPTQIGPQYVDLPIYYNGGLIVRSAGMNPVIGDRLFFGYNGVNGEAPKGQYADAVISLGSGDFEVYALNVEYSPTSLDHNK